jgi:hypothetical protein
MVQAVPVILIMKETKLYSQACSCLLHQGLPLRPRHLGADAMVPASLTERPTFLQKSSPDQYHHLQEALVNLHYRFLSTKNTSIVICLSVAVNTSLCCEFTLDLALL